MGVVDVDLDRLKQFQFLLFSKLEGAVTSGMVHLGDRLGLYRALATAEGPLTAAELAARTGLHERWVREWAYNQAAARLIAADDGGDAGDGDGGDGGDGEGASGRAGDGPAAAERFTLPPEAVAVLADSGHEAFGLGMFHRLPRTMAVLEDLPDSFRTGIGRDYDAHGPDGAVGIERSFEPWNRAHLIPTVLPALDGVVAKLAGGARVADIGCGAGGAVLMLAEAFPRSRVAGYDISRYALHRARERLAAAGLENASFHDPRVDPLPADGSVDLVTTFDCIHDMTDPQGMIRAIHAALADDGTWLLVDIKALDTYAENVTRNPMASLMYGVSVLSCMSSALSEPGGAGLGTLGLTAGRAEAMARAARFTRFRRLPVDHAINAFYEVRP